MDLVLTVVLAVVAVAAIAGNIFQAWMHYRHNETVTESHDDVIFNLNEHIQLTTREHGSRMVQVVMEFSARLTALEELALIEAKERREYLKLANVKIQERQAAIAQARAEGKPVIPHNYYTESEEFIPDPLDEMLASGSRRGKPREAVEDKTEKKEEVSA